MARTIVMNVPCEIWEILVYHSGKKTYTTKMSNITGKLKNMATGKPLSILLVKELSLSRSFSQLSKNCLSFSVSILQN